MAGIRRKNGKCSYMSPAVSCSRLRQLQCLLRNGGSEAPDGILCSLGIDSRYNEGCSELACYLFFGLYRHNVLDLELIPEDFPEEVLDDVIVLIKAESVHLYCNPVNYGYLLPYVSHWRNLHLHCMTEAEYEDEEAAEEFKISSFVSMVQDCSRIGVPYSSQGHMQKFDMFMLEKWPIIQAFALEGIGAGGFFTMKYKLMDVSERLWQTYTRLDPVSLDCLLTEDLVTFGNQWSCLFSSFDIESPLSLQELSEAQAGEPFRTYFSHGLISSNITDQSKSRQPFVLFGSHSCMEDLESYCFTFPSEGHQIRNTGPRGGTAKHMLLRCVAPKGPLACARTYFFGSTHVPYLGNDNVQQKKTELLLLSQIYSAVVQSVLSGIKCYSYNASATKAKDVAEQTFQLALDSFGLAQYRSALRSKAEFSIQAVNKEGRVVPLSNEDSGFLVKTASMVVSDIPDFLWGGGDLGSVVFSESFLESSISIQEKDGGVSSDSCFTVLTSAVPRYACWLVDESDVKLSEEAQHLVKEEGTCLGTLLAVGDSAQVFSCSLLSTPEEGKLVFFSEGILFVHPHYGSITISKNHISTIKLYDGDSLSAVSMLYVEYESSLLAYLPFPLHSTDRCLAIALLPRTKSYKSFYSQVLQAWHGSDSGVRLQLVGRDQLNLEQRNMYSRLQRLQETHSPAAPTHRRGLKTAYPQLPEQDKFLQHFALSSSVCEEPVSRDHLGALFPNTQPCPALPENSHKVVVFIISGLPGCHKDELCKFLVDLNQECGRWVVYRPEPEGFCVSQLQRFLSSLLETHRETQHTPRLLLLTPGYTDVCDVVQSILSHPDPLVQSGLTVGTVTACVNPLTSFMEHRFLFPKLLEQCSQGIVSNVVFTGLTVEQKHPLLQHVQQLIRSANPNAAFILAERGAVTRNEDMRLILSENSFTEPHMIRARYLLYPGWCEGKFVSGSASLSLSQHRLQFSRPLERALFLHCCKALKASRRASPFRGNVYNIWGKVCFSDCDRLMEVSYNAVSGSLTVAPDQGPPSGDASLQTPHGPPGAQACYLLFDGVGLTQDGLKDWLRLSAKQKLVNKLKRNQKSLTHQEIRNIHVKRHLEPLPPGYFYNGHQFVSFFGEKRIFHPLMEQFVEEYLEEANKEIESFNREVDLQPHADLFDP